MDVKASTKPELLVWIEITQKCQLKCRYCYNEWRQEPSSEHLSMSDQTRDELFRFIGSLSETYDLQFAVAGGDPTAHEDYLSIVRELAEFGSVGIVSHGCEFPDDELSEIAGIPSARIQFSIPSLNEDQFRFMTGGASLRVLLSNLANAASKGVPMTISKVVSGRSEVFEEIDQVLQLAQNAGVSMVVFNRFLEAGRGKFYGEEFRLSEADFVRQVADAKDRNGNSKLKVYVSGDLNGVRDRKLTKPKITICYDGSIKYCSMASNNIGQLGDTGDEVMRRYGEFWKSDRVDNNCACSRYVGGRYDTS